MVRLGLNVISTDLKINILQIWCGVLEPSSLLILALFVLFSVLSGATLIHGFVEAMILYVIPLISSCAGVTSFLFWSMNKETFT